MKNTVEPFAFYGVMVGILGLGALLTSLKLSHHLSWHWWVILAPLWVPPALFGLLILVFMFSKSEPPRSGY